jgi:site-specific recombinase XerD
LNARLSAADLAQVRAQRRGLAHSAQAPNTIKSYASDWRDFAQWCRRARRRALPATTETVALYLADLLLGRGRRVATAQRRASAIAGRHGKEGLPNPAGEEIRELLRCAKRSRQEPPRQKAALTVEQLRRICREFGGDELAIRNRAMLLAGFASSLRRSTLVELDLADVSFEERGMEIRIRREKQDQEGKGRRVGVPCGKHPVTCPVQAVRDWLSVRGQEPGPLFTHIGSLERLKPAAVAWTVKRAVECIGLDSKQYGGHSLRAGFITAAGEANVNHLLIMAQTGHRSVQTLVRYFRRQDVFRSNACAALDL